MIAYPRSKCQIGNTMATLTNLFKKTTSFSGFLSRTTWNRPARTFHHLSLSNIQCHSSKRIPSYTLFQSELKGRSRLHLVQFQRTEQCRGSSYFRSVFVCQKFRGFRTSPRRDAWPVAALLVKLLGPLSKISKLAAMIAGR